MKFILVLVSVALCYYADITSAARPMCTAEGADPNGDEVKTRYTCATGPRVHAFNEEDKCNKHCQIDCGMQRGYCQKSPRQNTIGQTPCMCGKDDGIYWPSSTTQTPKITTTPTMPSVVRTVQNTDEPEHENGFQTDQEVQDGKEGETEQENGQEVEVTGTEDGTDGEQGEDGEADDGQKEDGQGENGQGGDGEVEEGTEATEDEAAEATE